MPTNKVIEEQYEDLHSKLTSKVYGVTEELKELLNIDDDININLGNSLNQGTSGHANLADLVVRSGKKKEDLSIHARGTPRGHYPFYPLQRVMADAAFCDKVTF